MNCQDVRENFWGYRREQLSAELTSATAQHLQVCAACSSEFESLNQIDTALDRFPEIEPSPYFDQRLNARLDALEKRSPRSVFWTAWLRDRYAWSFVLLLATTVTVWVGIRHQQGKQLNSMGDVQRIQEKYLGKKESSDGLEARKQNGKKPEDSEVKTEAALIGSEDVISEEDLPVLENIDLLQNYDFLKNFDLADASGKLRSR